ncbi:Aste57867_21532 [Aphanomyces stellatus]|uniref:Aste57867_21532 protein n=1 Tax=Aphanomyces stellatus TaxID=120398 RepID=A0A485LJ17_9STRA|nr:hypothetical protein As57867_021463 [Aphanomyces stellatus]VFT98202.1 Aste57867_21532 [Aphanomyces stellatus]
MIVMVLSPAKTLDMSLSTHTTCTQPTHLNEASILVDELRKLSQAKLKALLGVSDAIAKLNYDRYKNFVKEGDVEKEPTETFKQAVLAFDGPAYKGLQSETWSADDLSFAQDHLRILCGLYGTLHPLDLIQAYRLEMGQKVANPRGKDLYEFWGRTIADDINATFASSSTRTKAANILLNVASIEYFKSLDQSALDEDITVVDCVFKDDGQIKSVYAKRARGLMVNHVVTTRATTLADIQAFSSEGYVFSTKDSSATTLVFHRSKAAAAEALKRKKAATTPEPAPTKRVRRN